MTEGDRIFSRFPPFIQEFIYEKGWQGLRDVQMQAAKALLETERHVLISSSTASGKTEAVFFPILTRLWEEGAEREGISVIYIAPLKSLINDQFFRMEELLDESGFPVCRWHGDVGASARTNLLLRPRGILQITPESLESMLIHRSNDLYRLFGNLRYVVLDEVHTMIGTDRGNQVLCQIERLSRLIGKRPVRVGLSATIGDPKLAQAWLCGGDPSSVTVVRSHEETLRWRLAMEHFYLDTPEESKTEDKDKKDSAPMDRGYTFLYDAVKNKKALVFSNSREETEYVTATLRQIAAQRKEKDVFLIHHGNLSASIREDAELKMKEEDAPTVTCATVTMELGIDIGRLDRVAEMGAPYRVSSFLQRLGRSGRRGQPPEMVMVYREETPLPNAPLPQLIPFELLRGIAIVQLYRESRFIEPPPRKEHPMSLLFHQTLSFLASSGEMQPKRLAEFILSLPPFQKVSKEAYRTLLLSMLEKDMLELTEEGGVILGLAGERLLESFKFYAVFQDSEDFTVRCDSEEIGTITNPIPVGDRFALAGRVWEVVELDTPHKLIFVKGVAGKMEISWPGDSGEVHTKILERMYRVLTEPSQYPYLMPNAAKRLKDATHTALTTGMKEHMLLPMGDSKYCLFPWLGTAPFRTLRRFLKFHSATLGLYDLRSEGCLYMTFQALHTSAAELWARICRLMREEGIHPEHLLAEGEVPMLDKYDPYIPPELLRSAYAEDRLSVQEILDRFLETGLPSAEK